MRYRGPRKVHGIAPRSAARALACTLAWVVAGAAIPGCVKAPVLVGGGVRIREVRLEGVKAFPKKKVLDHLFAGETSWVPFTPNYPYDEALTGVDVRRLEALYRAHGWYQARVLGVDAKVDAKKKKADLVIRVEEGQQARVRTLKVAWPADCDVPDAVRAVVEAEATLQEGGPFEVGRVNESLGRMRQELLVRGRPLAKVAGGAEVHEAARLADVSFEVDPGPEARVGRVVFEGLRGVPDRLVQKEVRFALGERWSPALVQQVEQAAKSLQVFRWVSAQPAEAVVDGRVDVVVRVSEADPQSVRAGVQIAIETARWQQQASVDYAHVNLFHNLTRFDLKMVGGWAELPNPWDWHLHGPVVAVVPTLSRKGFLEDHLVWAITPAFEMNLQEGYQYWAVKGQAGLARWFEGRVHLSLNYNAHYVDFFHVSPTLDARKSLLGRDFRDPYFLSFLELRMEAYLTDAIVNPKNGIVLDFVYDLAGGILGGTYDYHKIVLGMRGYLKAASWLQFAGRMQAGMILPYWRHPGAPISQRFYLGGANTVRGWGARRLSPRLEETDPDTGEKKSIPVGGDSMVEATFEMRFRLWGPLSLVGFLDMGDVQAAEHSFRPAKWNYAAGPGLRYDSPLGLVRLDVGFHLNDTGDYPEEPFWAVHFGLGEAF